MPWIAVNYQGAVPNVLPPEGSLLAALLDRDKVLPQHLEGKKRGQEWIKIYGTPDRPGPGAAAWYKILEMPVATEPKFRWKIGVSYWTARFDKKHYPRYGPQWLWIYKRSRTYVMAPAKDYFFVKLPKPDDPWQAPVGLPDRTSMSESVLSEHSDPEDSHEEPQQEPVASVLTQG